MQAQVRDADRVIVQTGNGLGTRSGHTVVEVDAATEAAIVAAFGQSNGGVTLAADMTVAILPPDLPPIVYAASVPIAGRVRTTTATPAEVWRLALRPKTGYAAMATLLGVDAGNGAVRKIVASVCVKRLLAGAVLVGTPVVVASHADAAATAWAIASSVAGDDYIVTVTGAAGRTVDWLVEGMMSSFSPEGIV